MLGGGYSKDIERIVLVNAFMFLVRVAAPSFTIGFLALTPAYVLQMPWAFLSSMFVHDDFMHIFVNMFFGVMMFGSYLEQLIGRREFIRTYFLGGLAAGLLYVAVSLAFGLPDPRTPAIGASGAVYAIIGALVMLRPNMRIYLYFLFPIPLWMFASFYMLYSMFVIPLGATGGVAVTAHLGGLIFGLYMGSRFKKRIAEPVYYNVRYY